MRDRRITREVAGNQSAGPIDLPSAIERVQKSAADVLHCRAKIVEPVAASPLNS